MQVSFTPGRRAHHMLARLAEGPAQVSELRHAAMPDRPAAKRRKAHFVLVALLDAGLVLRDGAGAYLITPMGTEALATLRDGQVAAFDTGPVYARPVQAAIGQAAAQR